MAAVALAALGLGGCIKYKQVVTVNPDGSGTWQLTVGFGPQFYAVAGSDADPFADFASVEKLKEEESHGFVAFTEPIIEEVDGYQTMTITGYFENINDLEIMQDEDDENGDADNAGDNPQPPTTFAFDDGTLTVQQPILSVMARRVAEEDFDRDNEHMRQMMAPMVAGTEISEALVVPGPIDEAGYLQADGNTAAFVVDADMLLDPDAATLDQLAGVETLTVTFDPQGWADGAEDAWQAELAAAKQAWAAWKQRGDAAAQGTATQAPAGQ